MGIRPENLVTACLHVQLDQTELAFAGIAVGNEANLNNILGRSVERLRSPFEALRHSNQGLLGQLAASNRTQSYIGREMKGTCQQPFGGTRTTRKPSRS